MNASKSARASGVRARTPRGTRPSPRGPLRRSRRTSAAPRDPSARRGCTRRSAPRAARRPAAPRSRRRCPRPRHRARARRGSGAGGARRIPPRRRAPAQVGCDEPLELLDRRLAEDRRRVADEVLPELAGLLLLLGRRAEAHRRSSKPFASSVPGERLLDDEDDAVPAPAEDVPDPDAVVGRPEGALREEDDGRHLAADPMRRSRYPDPAWRGVRAV